MSDEDAGAPGAHAPESDGPGSDTPGLDALEVEPAAAVEVFGDRVELARRYATSLAGDATVRGLVGPREAGRLWTRHLLNCAVVAELLPAGARVVDVGSGAGLPGIPLALARPDVTVTLVEPLERRTTYLAGVVADLGLSCRVVRSRAEQAARAVGSVDVVTARAVAPLGRLAEVCGRLLAPDGLLLALKGATAADELRRDRRALLKAGFADATVVEVGADVVDPPTLVVRAVKTPTR